MRVQTINGKKYILVIIDDYSRFTWVKFLRSKDETPAVVIKFLKQIQVGLNKTVRFIRTDNGTEFVNKTLYDYYESVGIFHQKTVPRTPQQNGVIERRNRTLVEAAWTMLIFSKAPMFLWAEAVATASRILENYNQGLILEFSLDMHRAEKVTESTTNEPDKSWLWHRRLNHLNFGTINDLARKDLVRGLPRLKFEKDHLCSACQLGKSKKHTHKPKTENTNLEVLNTLHMDLCGPMRVQTINGKKYILVIVDDYSRFTWVKFLRSKDETPTVVIKFLKQIQVGLNKTVRFIRTDNGTEFVNKTLYDYYESIGIFHQKTIPRTP
ncbi:retrovirus-related pol polyprotein from transposon TNT 1-94 [Tanacetum coccineum]